MFFVVELLKRALYSSAEIAPTSAIQQMRRARLTRGFSVPRRRAAPVRSAGRRLRTFLVGCGVANVHGARRVHAEPGECKLEHCRRRLRRSRLGGGDDDVHECVQPEGAEVVVQADVPVRDDREPEPGGRELEAGVARARQLHESQRRHERRRELVWVELGLERLEEDACTVAAKERERRFIAAFVRARDIERDFRLERALHIAGAALDANGPRARRAGPAPGRAT